MSRLDRGIHDPDGLVLVFDSTDMPASQTQDRNLLVGPAETAGGQAVRAVLLRQRLLRRMTAKRRLGASYRVRELTGRADVRQALSDYLTRLGTAP